MLYEVITENRIIGIGKRDLCPLPIFIYKKQIFVDRIFVLQLILQFNFAKPILEL